MQRLPKLPNRLEVLAFISYSVSYGNLGAFLGAGFSKAVLNDDHEDIALSWGELLKEASKKMGVNYEEICKEGIGFPEVASIICKKYSQENKCEYKQALTKLKYEISALTSWYPDKVKREKFSKYLNFLSPSWIITTNYDLIIESLLIGNSIPLGPNDSLSSPEGVIPVFHLHGLRTNPEEIIIAQEDYVSLFRPSEYRQIKLALTIKESTTLLLGYGLGDVNVLTALDWSKNVFNNKESNYPHDVIQVIRNQFPKNEPYRDQNGILIIETSDLSSFFDEFIAVREKNILEEDNTKNELNLLAKKLENPDAEMIEKFIDDITFRKDILDRLSNFSIHLVSGFVSFLDKCIDETWERSSESGAFQGYNQNLIIILDILISFELSKFPPALFQTVAYGLHRVSYYVGDARGQAYAAKKTWDKRKEDINKEIVSELRSMAKQHNYGNLNILIKDL